MKTKKIHPNQKVVELSNGMVAGFNSKSSMSCVNEIYIDNNGEVRLSEMSVDCPHWRERDGRMTFVEAAAARNIVVRFLD